MQWIEELHAFTNAMNATKYTYTQQRIIHLRTNYKKNKYNP